MTHPKHVYFIKPIGMDGPIKIGCSEKPSKRLIVLSAWSPFELELMGSVPGGFDDERRLHRRFADLHTRKEWFMLSPALRQTIEHILSGVSISDACKALKIKGDIRNQKRPARTPDRVLFLDYGRRIKEALRPLWDKEGNWRRPPDVEKIMHDWRCDKVHDHKPIIPTAEQIACLEEFLANPKTHAVYVKWKHFGIPKDPICIPHIAVAA